MNIKKLTAVSYTVSTVLVVFFGVCRIAFAYFENTTAEWWTDKQIEIITSYLGLVCVSLIAIIMFVLGVPAAFISYEEEMDIKNNEGTK